MMVMEEKKVNNAYRITEFGYIPIGWEVKKLKEISDFNNGKGHEKFIDDQGKYIVINSKFISTDGKVIKRSTQNLSPLNVHDIAMVMSDLPNGKALAKCFLVDKNDTYTLNQRICSIKGRDMNHTYLYYSLNRNSYFLKFDDGVGQTNLRKDEVLECPILVPPIQEQQKIANILSSFDDQIENTDQLIAKTKELKKGLLQQLLTKGIGHTEFKQTELGEIPVEWATTKLSEMSDFITKGSTPTTYGYEWVESGIPFFKSDVVKEGRFVYGDYKFISEEAHSQMLRSQIKPGDLLITITGNIGRVAIVPKEIKEANINQHIARIRIINEHVNPLFVYHWLNQEKLVEYYQLIKTGLAYPQISLKQVRETIVPLPLGEEQQKIVKILSTVDEQIETYEQEKEKYTELKKGLMQQLLTGKIRVTV